jgi:hypothetical protein
MHGAYDQIVCEDLEAVRFRKGLAEKPIHVFIGSAALCGKKMGKEKCGL